MARMKKRMTGDVVMRCDEYNNGKNEEIANTPIAQPDDTEGDQQQQQLQPSTPDPFPASQIPSIHSRLNDSNTNVIHRHTASRQVMNTCKRLFIQAPTKCPHRPPNPNPQTPDHSQASPFNSWSPCFVASSSRVVDISVYYNASLIFSKLD
ncbi:uncharacterized protein F5147DRAFT_777864 [Suillus discolor]|uniref:Uncharacterized protein n=1 Tax=Suillus discolor TaxID=1912936 RepID=A0A9P7F094_9AGAM|nr:uncharacterized protein F5147DRAFT_777864 [Suillus discolor]KAG2098001.1 hypothetical protein F5147DRAFT_777864 [Suillus discolor]